MMTGVLGHLHIFRELIFYSNDFLEVSNIVAGGRRSMMPPSSPGLHTGSRPWLRCTHNMPGISDTTTTTATGTPRKVGERWTTIGGLFNYVKLRSLLEKNRMLDDFPCKASMSCGDLPAMELMTGGCFTDVKTYRAASKHP